ncbi:MAG: B12-binding domain-containing radical SAM protein [Thermodesulfobacteriota bacterium]
MKKVLFITLYDEICYGVRLLSAVVKDCGLESHVVLLKGESQYVPIWRDKDEYSSYQYYYNGLLRGSFYAVDPITPQEVEHLLGLIRDIAPELICLSTRSFAYSICKDIFPLIKQNYPQIPIIAGGWGPTLEPDKFLEFSDYVCFGEGEKTLQAICACLRQGRDFREVSNLLYYDSGNLIQNKVEKPLNLKEMNALPFPDFSVDNKYLIHHGKLRLGTDFYNEKVYDCFAARGCPMNCSYCMSSKYDAVYRQKTQTGCPKYRLRDLDVVLQEVKAAKRRGAKLIRFKDEVFPVKPSWVREFLARYKTEVALPFFGYMRPEFHSLETIKALKDVGLFLSMVGIQSGSAEIREIYRRKLPKDKVIDFAWVLKENAIDYCYHFIYRNPFEKEEHLRESLEFTYHLPYAKTFIFKLEPFPKSPISEMIASAQPVQLPKNIQNWYAILHSLSLKNAPLRKVAQVAHRYHLCRKHPQVLSAFFLPYILKEVWNFVKNKYLFNARLQFSPSASQKARPMAKQPGSALSTSSGA